MTEDSSIKPVGVNGEERSRPVFRLLARAAIELARLGRTKHKDASNEATAARADDEGSPDA